MGDPPLRAGTDHLRPGAKANNGQPVATADWQRLLALEPYPRTFRLTPGLVFREGRLPWFLEEEKSGDHDFTSPYGPVCSWFFGRAGRFGVSLQEKNDPCLAGFYWHNHPPGCTGWEAARRELAAGGDRLYPGGSAAGRCRGLNRGRNPVS